MHVQSYALLAKLYRTCMCHLPERDQTLVASLVTVESPPNSSPNSPDHLV